MILEEEVCAENISYVENDSLNNMNGFENLAEANVKHPIQIESQESQSNAQNLSIPSS